MIRLSSMHARWNKSCQRSITLVGTGKDTYVYDGATNRYLKVNGAVVNGPATKDALANAIAQLTGQAAPGDTLKLYLGDHGAVQGTILQDRRALTPEMLKGVLNPWVNKGGRVLLMADHCFAGHMLEPLYDFSKGKSYGCGISDSNDDVSYTNNDLDAHNTIDERVRTNFSLESGGQTAINVFMRSSDRFLARYAKTFVPKTCVDCTVGKVVDTGWVGSIVQKLTDTPIDLAINQLDRQFNELRRNTPASIKNETASWAEFTRRNSEIDQKANAYFLSVAKKDPAFVQASAVRDNLQAQVTNWIRQNPGKNVIHCPTYIPSLTAGSTVGGFWNKYMANKKIGDIPGLPGRSFANPGLSLEQAKNANQGWIRKTMLHKTFLLKQSLFVLKRAALIKMKTSKDSNAIKIYLQLKTCEESESL
jgi:hypothetical protein